MTGLSIEDCVPFKDQVQKLIQIGVLSFVVQEVVINEVTVEDIAASTASSDPHIDVSKEVIECPKQSWDMISMTFNREFRREEDI